MAWLPRDIRDGRPLLQQWIDNNMSYLDARALEVFQSGDADFRRASWSVVPEPDGKPTGTFIVLLSGRWLGLPVRCQGGISTMAAPRRDMEGGSDARRAWAAWAPHGESTHEERF